MNEGKTVFAQLMDWLPKYEFGKCVKKHRGNYHVRELTCYEQYLIMAFAQLTGRDSLRAIVTCLEVLGPHLYHAGIRSTVARSTLADANEKRSWEIFSDFAHVLIREAVALYAEEEFGKELKQVAYALDSTTIDLCLSLFPWAKFRKHKAAIKLHTLLKLCGCIPTLVIITSGKVHDVNILDQLICEAGAFYVVDRGYLDFARLHAIHRQGAFFVTRAKKGFNFQRRYVRYSPDFKHWSSWQVLRRSEPQSHEEKKNPGRYYSGTIRVPYGEQNEYNKLIFEYSRQDVPWKSDGDAAVRWILERQPDFFSKHLPFIGYVEFRYEGGFYGGQRIKSFKAGVSYGMSGKHLPPKNKDIYKDRDSRPWSFKAEEKEQKAE